MLGYFKTLIPDGWMIVKSYVKTYVPQSWSQISPDLSMNIYDIPMFSTIFWLLNSSFGPDPRSCLDDDDDDEKSPWPLALGVLRSSMERTLRPGQVALCAPWRRRRWHGELRKTRLGPLGYAGVHMVNTWLTQMIFRFHRWKASWGSTLGFLRPTGQAFSGKWGLRRYALCHIRTNQSSFFRLISALLKVNSLHSWILYLNDVKCD